MPESQPERAVGLAGMNSNSSLLLTAGLGGLSGRARGTRRGAQGQAHQGHLPTVGVDTTPTRLRRDTARRRRLEVIRVLLAETGDEADSSWGLTPCGGRTEAAQAPGGLGHREGQWSASLRWLGRRWDMGATLGIRNRGWMFLRGGVSGDGCWGHWTGPSGSQEDVVSQTGASGAPWYQVGQGLTMCWSLSRCTTRAGPTAPWAPGRREPCRAAAGRLRSASRCPCCPCGHRVGWGALLRLQPCTLHLSPLLGRVSSERRQETPRNPLRLPHCPPGLRLFLCKWVASQ